MADKQGNIRDIRYFSIKQILVQEYKDKNGAIQHKKNIDKKVPQDALCVAWAVSSDLPERAQWCIEFDASKPKSRLEFYDAMISLIFWEYVDVRYFLLCHGAKPNKERVVD